MTPPLGTRTAPLPGDPLDDDSISDALAPAARPQAFATADEIESARMPAAHPSAAPALESPTGSSQGPGTAEFAPARRGGWWGWLALAGVCAGIYFYWPRIKTYIPPLPGFSAPATKPPIRIAPVVTATARLGDLDLYLNGLGTVTAFKTVTIRSRVEGELVNVAFTEGQMVQELELLAEIDPRPYQTQLAQAEGQLARDEATLKVAQLTLNRYRRLIQSGAITAQEIDQQVALVQEAEGTIKSDKATIANVKLQLTYCHITAPITGRIGLRLVDSGNIVRANDPNGLAVITQLQPIAVIFTIPQDDIGRVQARVKQGSTLSVTAYNRDFSVKLASGTLSALDNQVDPATGTVRLKSIFANEDNMLFPNQFVNARLLVDTLRNAVIVPSAAVQRGPDSTFVYVVLEDKTVELRKVEVGPGEGDQTSIARGLAAGDVVVTDGLDKLQPGSKVDPHDRQSASAKDAKGDPSGSRGPGPSANGTHAGLPPPSEASPAPASGKSGQQGESAPSAETGLPSRARP